jgi:hypothetical protein
MCLCTSRLKIAPTPDAGIFIGRFSGHCEGVACAGRQSPGQWKKDISACGEKSSPSPWSSPQGEEITLTAFAVHRLPSTSGDQRLSAAAPFSGYVLSSASCEAGLSASRRGTAGIAKESNQVQAIDFHRRDAETRRDCGVGESARERVEMSGGTRRSGSNLRGLAALRDKSGIFGANWSESNLVQAKIFSGLSGAGWETPPGPGGMRDRRGWYLIYMQAGTPRCEVRVAERSVRRRNPPVSRVHRPSTNSAR